mgnify:CR=1 FL=1
MSTNEILTMIVVVIVAAIIAMAVFDNMGQWKSGVYIKGALI